LKARLKKTKTNKFTINMINHPRHFRWQGPQISRDAKAQCLSAPHSAVTGPAEIHTIFEVELATDIPSPYKPIEI
jgi:hypothetical protein